MASQEFKIHARAPGRAKAAGWVLVTQGGITRALPQLPGIWKVPSSPGSGGLARSIRPGVGRTHPTPHSNRDPRDRALAFFSPLPREHPEKWHPFPMRKSSTSTANGGKKAVGGQRSRSGRPRRREEGQRRGPVQEAGPRGGFRGVVPPGQHGAGRNERWPPVIDQRPPNRVGEEGFEPSRPFGHTDLNRARLPFRHPPGRGKKVSTTPSALMPRIRSEASCEGRCHGGSSAAL
jgi:hypothetical protein